MEMKIKAFPFKLCIKLYSIVITYLAFKRSTVIYNVYMSPVMRKPGFCICENKDAYQLRDNREADQRLCFRYTDSTIPLLSESEISSLWPSSVTVQPGLCLTRSETRTFVFS